MESNDNFICPFCELNYSNRSEVQKHILETHVQSKEKDAVAVKPVYRCPVCDMVVADELSLVQHAITEHQDISESSIKEEDDCEIEEAFSPEDTIINNKLKEEPISADKQIKSYNIDCQLMSNTQNDFVDIQSLIKISNITKCVPQLDSDPQTITANVTQTCDTVHKGEESDSPESPSYSTTNCTGMTTRSYKLKSKASKFYKCLKCDFKTHNRKILNAHKIEKHTKKFRSEKDKILNVKVFACKDCKFVAVSNALLNRHILTAHTDKLQDTIFRCSVCNYKAENERLLTDHYVTMHTQEEEDTQDNTNNIENKLRIKEHKCIHCDMETKSNVAFNYHMKTKHKEHLQHQLNKKKDYNCFYCDFNATGNVTLTKHIKLKHNEYLLLCDYCYFEAITKDKLNRHITSVHRQEIIENAKYGTKPVRKPLPGQMAPDEPQLTPTKKRGRPAKHKAQEVNAKLCQEEALSVKKKRGRKPKYTPSSLPNAFSCCFCSYSGISKASLQFHKHNRHKEERKGFNCLYCNFMSLERKALMDHAVETHRELIKFCPTCGVPALNEARLANHIYVNHQKKRYTQACPFCDFTGRMETLLQHKIEAHKERLKLHTCEVCGFEAYEESIVRGHIVLEHKERCKMFEGQQMCCPKKCNYLCYEYRRLLNHDLRKHRDRSTIRVLKYRCDTENCDQVFNSIKDFYQHRSVVHGKKPLNSCLEDSCSYVCKRRRDLRKHLEDVHCIQMKRQRHSFNTEQDFLTWLRALETETCARYIQLGVSKDHIEYQCNRSGRFYISPQMQEKGVTKKGFKSFKSGATCTATIACTMHLDGHLDVDACLTHYGHEMSAEVLHFSHNEKAYLQEKLLAGQSYEEILNGIRNDLMTNPNIKLQRMHLVTKSYLIYLRKAVRQKYTDANLPRYSTGPIKGRGRAKKKEQTPDTQSISHALFSRIEHKLSALKSHASDLSNSSLLEIDKKLSTLDDLVKSLPVLEDFQITEEGYHAEVMPDSADKMAIKGRHLPSKQNEIPIAPHPHKRMYIEPLAPHIGAIAPTTTTAAVALVTEQTPQTMYLDLSQQQPNIIHHQPSHRPEQQQHHQEPQQLNYSNKMDELEYITWQLHAEM